MTTIDFTLYSNMPRLDAAAAFVLAITLYEAPPSDLSTAERAALRKVATTAQRLKDVQRARAAEPTGTIRPCQLAATAAWSAFYTALSAVARLPVGSRLDVARAQKLLDVLFPSGIAFTQQDAKSVLSDGQTLLDTIDHDALARDLHRVIDDAFLQNVRDRQSDLRTALGIGREHHALDLVGDVLNDLMRDIGSYVRVLAGGVNLDDDASVQRFADAVSPIDEARASLTRTPSTVVPPVVPPPPAPIVSPTPTPVAPPSPAPVVPPDVPLASTRLPNAAE